MVEIFEPRYRDRCILIAKYKICPGYPMQIRILKGSYKGKYRIPAKVLSGGPYEIMKTKTGKNIEMKAIALDSLERMEDEQFN